MKTIYCLSLLFLSVQLSGQSLVGAWYNESGSIIRFNKSGIVKVNNKGSKTEGTYQFYYKDSIATLQIQWQDATVFEYIVQTLTEEKLEFMTPEGLLFSYINNNTPETENPFTSLLKSANQPAREKPCPRCLNSGVSTKEVFNVEAQRTDQIVEVCPICAGSGTVSVGNPIQPYQTKRQKQ